MMARLCAVLVAVCLFAMAADDISVDAVVSTVRAALSDKQRDSTTAATLSKMKLAQQLPDRVIEILESEGAGPQTLGALQHLRDASRLLSPPSDPPQGMTPPPPPSYTQVQETWHVAAAKALAYDRALPDFLCLETIHRWLDPTGREMWQAAPAVVVNISYFDRKEQYSVVSVGGKKSKESVEEVAGAMSQGEFGTMLETILGPAAQADYTWDHWTILRKRPTSVYYFRIPADRQPYQLKYGAPPAMVKTFVGLSGYLYIDPESRNVTRISATAEDIPAGFPVQRSSTVLDYDYAEIGGQRYLLPMRAETRLDAGKIQSLNALEFQQYRKFASDTKVTLGK
jgi:hypothetical protein